MKILAGFVVLFSSLAFGYQEQTEIRGPIELTQWVSDGLTTSTSNAPVRGYFYAATDVFKTQGSCKDFNLKVSGLIQDWKNYPGINLYSLATCSSSATESTTVFLYAVDVWSASFAANQRKFIKDHQGLDFLGHELDFSEVQGLTVKSVVTLGHVAGNTLTPVYQVDHSFNYDYEDEWYPHHLVAVNAITQSNKGEFLKFIESEFGSSQELDHNLPSSNYIMFADFFILHLTNGKEGNFWLGWGANKNCGTQACYK